MVELSDCVMSRVRCFVLTLFPESPELLPPVLPQEQRVSAMMHARVKAITFFIWVLFLSVSFRAADVSASVASFPQKLLKTTKNSMTVPPCLGHYATTDPTVSNKKQTAKKLPFPAPQRKKCI